MFDIGWSELAVIAVLALLVIGPKDLPSVMRTMGKWMQKARGISREFQSSVDEMIREAELDDARKALDTTRNLNVQQTIENAIDPDGEVKESARELERDARREDTGSETAKIDVPKTDAPKTETIEAPKPAGSPEAAAETPSGDGEPLGKATVVRHPAKVAPGNSVTPPVPEGVGLGSPESEARHEPRPEPEPEPAAAPVKPEGGKSASGGGGA